MRTPSLRRVTKPRPLPLCKLAGSHSCTAIWGFQRCNYISLRSFGSVSAELWQNRVHGEELVDEKGHFSSHVLKFASVCCMCICGAEDVENKWRFNYSRRLFPLFACKCFPVYLLCPPSGRRLEQEKAVHNQHFTYALLEICTTATQIPSLFNGFQQEMSTLTLHSSHSGFDLNAVFKSIKHRCSKFENWGA